MIVDLIEQFRALAIDTNLDPFTTSYCINRINSEGISFLVVTLPKLSSSVLRSLELGYFDRSELTCFKWKRKSLLFFQKFLNKIFCPKTGLVLEVVDPVSLGNLRQLCDYSYKLALPFTDKQLEDAASAYKNVERSLGLPFDRDLVDRVRKDFETHFPAIRKSVPSDVFHQGLVRPGPGTFAGKDRDWYLRKYRDFSYTKELNPFSGHFRYSKPTRLGPPVKDSSDYSEVLFVPKDSRGPRVISREPFIRLKAQMAFFDWLTNALHWATSHRIEFHDQSANRELARLSSIDKGLSTIDLSSASDRVRFDVCLNIFSNCPAIRFFLLNVRTTHAKLNGEIIRLKKVSGMGSGLTFPLMSFLLYLVSVRAIVDNSRYSYKQAMKLVCTFGDDLIIPTKYVSFVTDYIEKVGLVVNRSKSFSSSFFRESCGGDYYFGHDVTPVRFKLSSGNIQSKGTKLYLKDPGAILGLERHCRELYSKGMYSLLEYYYRVLETRLGELPYITEGSPVLGRMAPVSVALSKLRCDSTGTFKNTRVWLVSQKVRREDLYQYEQYLGAKLNRSSSCNPDVFSIDTVGNTHGVSIPRTFVLHRKKVNYLKLVSGS